MAKPVVAHPGEASQPVITSTAVRFYAKAMADDDWILPAGILFDELKGRDLEECADRLSDAMGGKDLEWRLGGGSKGTSDGGRDWESTFHVPGFDGEMEAQRRWIECKGRGKTVEAEEVRARLITAPPFRDVTQTAT